MLVSTCLSNLATLTGAKSERGTKLRTRNQLRTAHAHERQGDIPQRLIVSPLGEVTAVEYDGPER